MIDSDTPIPVPNNLPPVDGLDDQDEYAPRNRPRIWLWTMGAALAVILLMGYVIVLGVLGFYDGLKDRAIENQLVAQEHYAAGVEYLEAAEYELAIAEFELALRYDSSLEAAHTKLLAVKETAGVEVTPTSETRRDAAMLLYRQAVAHYESGNLSQAVAVLDELRGLDPDYQQENVLTMLIRAHNQLGMQAVGDDRLTDAKQHFESILALKPQDANAQDQLNLIRLYMAALNYWDRDWTASIQALKGLYALAPEYKDVRERLHEAYLNQAQAYADQGNWCQAAGAYAAAVEIAPLEETVDRRDDAAIQCQTAAEAPTPASTSQAAVQPTARPTTSAPGETPAPGATATSVTSTASSGKGRIAFASYDAVRKRYDIYSIDLGQGDARLLQESANQPAFAPGGGKLAFRNQDPNHLGLDILDLGTNELHEVTAHYEDSVPTWSPNKDQLAFASNKHGDRRWRVYVISPQEVRGEGEEWVYGQMPAWSPNGDRIAYHGCDERADNCGVWIMKPGGFALQRLSSDASDTSPSWSPDGKWVAFISSRAGNWEIYSVEVATGQESRLTNHAAADVGPAWSPDGKQLGFLSNREGAWAVYVLNINSGKVTKVIATGDAYLDPVAERLSWISQ